MSRVQMPAVHNGFMNQSLGRIINVKWATWHGSGHKRMACQEILLVVSASGDTLVNANMKST